MPDVEARVVSDQFKPAECQRISMIVAKEQPVEHSLNGGVGIIDEQIERSSFHRKLTSQRVALNVAFDIIGVMFGISHESIHAVNGNRQVKHD